MALLLYILVALTYAWQVRVLVVMGREPEDGATGRADAVGTSGRAPLVVLRGAASTPASRSA